MQSETTPKGTERYEIIATNGGSEVDRILNLPLDRQIACIYLIQKGINGALIDLIRPILVYQMPMIEYVKRTCNLKLAFLKAPEWISKHFDYDLFSDELQLSDVVAEVTIDNKPWTVIPDNEKLDQTMDGMFQKPSADRSQPRIRLVTTRN